MNLNQCWRSSHQTYHRLWNVTYWISDFTKDSQVLLPHMSILKALGEKKNLDCKIGIFTQRLARSAFVGSSDDVSLWPKYWILSKKYEAFFPQKQQKYDGGYRQKTSEYFRWGGLHISMLQDIRRQGLGKSGLKFRHGRGGYQKWPKKFWRLLWTAPMYKKLEIRAK